MDDVGFREVLPVDLRHEHERSGALIVSQFRGRAAGADAHRPAAVAARCLYRDRNLLSSQSPLHEGRRQRVLRSGTVQPLAGVEGQAVGGRFHGDRVSPRDGALPVSNEKEEIALQLVEQPFHAGDGDS